MSKFRFFTPQFSCNLHVRRGFFVSICGVLIVANVTYAQSSDKTPLSLRLDDQLIVRDGQSDDKSLTFTSSQKIEGTNDRTVNLSGDAEIRRNGSVVKGDKISYDPDTDIADVTGKAKFIKDTTTFAGPRARLKLDSQEGWMESPDYELRDTRGSGHASRADFLGDDKILLSQPTYTTCTPENLAWYFSSNEMEIDREKKEGIGTGGVLHFMGAPIFYTPYFSLPMSSERRSGFLAPTVGLNSNNGLDLTVPYYYNIAPNRDLTIYPRYLSLRGTQLGGEYRYLESNYSGTLLAEYLPNDSITNTNRWAYSWRHQQLLSPGLTFYSNVNRVSDDFYADDLGRSVGQAISRQFTQELGLNYGYQGWNFLTRVQKYQTLQPDPTAIVALPYDREPQVNARYRNLNWNGAIVNFEADYTRFTYNGALDAPGTTVFNRQFYAVNRSFVNTSVSFPYITPGYYVTPKISLRANTYNTESNPLYQGVSQSYTLPTMSLDSGMFFERDAPELKGLFGREMLMTLEPRIMYVYTPYQDQTQLPLLDTGPMGFGISQIFSENTFVGNDRFADNNKVTAGVTTRILDAETGIERVRAIVAQRIDLSGQRVGLYSDVTADQLQSQNKYSDLLMAASTRLMGNLNLDIANQHNIQLNRSVQTSMTASWRPSPRRMLNFSYRYTYDPTIPDTTIYQYEVSGQWPLTKNLYGIGRWNYDKVSEKTLNTLVGLEYDQDCWAARVAVQKFLNTSLVSTTQIFFQLEFKGLGGMGNNPIDIMRLNIPGYMPVNQAPTPVSRFERYE